MRIRRIGYLYAIVMILAVLGLGISSCQDSGGGITDSNDPNTPNEPTEINSSFESEDTDFLPGEIELINIEGTTLSEGEYVANLADGAEITLYRYEQDTEQKTLLFIIPEILPESHELIFTLDEQEQTLDFNIQEYEVIEDAEELVSSHKTQITNQLNKVIDETSDEETKQILETALLDIDEAMEDFSSLDEAEQKLIAYIIKENIGSINASKGTAVNSYSICSDIETRLSESPKRVATAATAGVSGGFLGGIKGTIINIFSTSGVFEILSRTIDDLSIFIDECIVPELSLGSLSSNKSIESYTFNHNREQTFSVSSTKRLSEEIEASIKEIQSALGSLLSSISASWSNFLFANDFIEEEPVNTSIFSLSNISDPDITADYSSAESEVSFTFSFKDEVMPVEDRSFTFNYGDAESSLEVEAILTPATPIVYDMQISVKAGESVTDTLQGDYVASFSIESNPSNGTVTLLDAETGVFGYDADANFSDSDSFTFSATNSSGSSEVATVTVHAAGENEFIFDGQTYPLEWGVIYDYGEFTTGSRNFDFVLTQKEGEYMYDDFDDYYYYDTSNSEYAMYLWLESKGASSFDAGTFTFSSDTTVQYDYIYDGEISFGSDDSYVGYEVIGGTVGVSISDNIYTLIFDLALDNGKSLTGSFTYPFEIIIEEELGSSAFGVQSSIQSSKGRIKK